MDTTVDYSKGEYHLFGMDAFKKGWFTETGSMSGDNAISIKVDEILYEGKSKFQDIIVFRSKRFGRVLVLDNAIQCSEMDECSYQEMISFLPLMSHPNPKKVLIIGGGDGGVVREVTKHPSVEEITLVEIDEEVIRIAKEFLPFMAKGFASPKLTLIVGDGAEYVKNTKHKYDIIITDSSDPKGPAVCLFRKNYYEDMKKILNTGGIICSQGESFWFDEQLIREMVQMCRSLFPVVDYGSSYIATYPGGQIGYLMCGLSPETNFRQPLNELDDKLLEEYNLKYYTPNTHRAAFALPLKIAKNLGICWKV